VKVVFLLYNTIADLSVISMNISRETWSYALYSLFLLCNKLSETVGVIVTRVTTIQGRHIIYTLMTAFKQL